MAGPPARDARVAALATAGRVYYGRGAISEGWVSPAGAAYSSESACVYGAESLMLDSAIIRRRRPGIVARLG